MLRADVINSGVMDGRQETIDKAAGLIVQRHPESDGSQVRSIVEAQFDALAGDPTHNSPITIGLLVQLFENAVARQASGDTQIAKKIEKVLFKCLAKKPQHQSVQTSELAVAFQTQTQSALQYYRAELETVVKTLENRDFISVKQVGGAMQPLFYQGIDFDVWERQMKKDDESKASVVNNFHLNGPNARFNLHSTDNSTNTNVAGDGANIQSELASLRREIQTADLPDAQRAEALEQIDVIDEQFASGKPKKSIVTTLLNALPKVGSVASIVSAIHACWPH